VRPLLKWGPADIAINSDEVLRYLGYKPGKRISSRVERMLEREIEAAYRLIVPRGYFCTVDAPALPSIRLFQDAEKVAFGVATIGSRLERKVNALFQQGEAARGVLLDAVGSVAAEAVTDLVNREVNRYASGLGFKTTRRFSPGYGPWHVDGQHLVFQYLGKAAGRIGITLTSSNLMIPLKSVSFAVKMGRGKMEEINLGRCASCSMAERCPFRHDRRLCTKAAFSDSSGRNAAVRR